MKQYRLIINTDAEADLKLASDWYASKKEGLDQDFIQEIEKSIYRIQDNPMQFAYIK